MLLALLREELRLKTKGSQSIGFYQSDAALQGEADMDAALICL